MSVDSETRSSLVPRFSWCAVFRGESETHLAEETFILTIHSMITDGGVSFSVPLTSTKSLVLSMRPPRPAALFDDSREVNRVQVPV